MQFPRRPSPASTYESQAARWKQGFKPGTAAGSARQTDLEGALVSELCSSIGSSSFPPREVLQKLLRYLHTLDHEVSRAREEEKGRAGLTDASAVCVRAAGRQVPEPAVAGAGQGRVGAGRHPQERRGRLLQAPLLRTDQPH